MDFKVIEVISLDTKKKIKIKDYRFNPEFHKHVGSKEEVVAPDPVVGETIFEFEGQVYKTEAAMKAAITRAVNVA